MGCTIGPRQRHEQHLLALQFELAILPRRLPVFLFHGHQQHAGLNLHQIVAPPVDHPELQALMSWYDVISIFSLKPIFADGRETRPNSRPVATANPRTPTSDSIDATMLDPRLFGEMLPYPTVLSVCALKKKSLRNRPRFRGRVGAR